jgi:hypothetical protein
MTMKPETKRYDLHLSDMTYREDWRILLALSKGLEGAGIQHKVDGKTMIFAHGLEFKLEKICLTFHWRDEKKVMNHFGYGGGAKETEYPGFRYFDASHEGKKVRCMFYRVGSGEDELLYRNTDIVDVDGQTLRVQSLEFYLENAEPKDEFYEMVERYRNRKV